MNLTIEEQDEAGNITATYVSSSWTDEKGNNDGRIDVIVCLVPAVLQHNEVSAFYYCIPVVLTSVHTNSPLFLCVHCLKVVRTLEYLSGEDWYLMDKTACDLLAGGISAQRD
ncbi:MAG: hypothetical protein L6R41_002630 [Letrouitia leprolyta]|nr:MAG: hypothetical protein L6R41_002630 [Letrouitia leprolyta]